MVAQPAVQAAAQRGFLAIRVSKLARAADVSESTVRRWWFGRDVCEKSVDAIEGALGLRARNIHERSLSAPGPLEEDC